MHILVFISSFFSALIVSHSTSILVYHEPWMGLSNIKSFSQ